ncbi:hypothetical protein V8B97DRAFT_1914663 [Scleroderma yunnanense]
MNSLYDDLKVRVGMLSLRYTHWQTQAEYCPPVDTSLLAALVAELEGSAHSPSQDEVATLRATLQEIAEDATAQYENELCEELSSAHLSSQYYNTDDSFSFTDYNGETTESSTSELSILSNQSFSSPLGFLQAALPHIPPSKLRSALSDAGSGSDVDMESVVENLLTNEYLRELEERGLDALDDGEDQDLFGDEGIWHLVVTKKKAQLPSPSKKTAKKNARGKTITLVDIRQKQHIPSPVTQLLSKPPSDMWTQISSLSEHLASLLPPYKATFFQSYFHSPNYSSPAKAVRAALSDIVDKERSPRSPKPTLASENPSVLFTLLDVIRDSQAYTTLNAEQRSTVCSDAQLALTATQGCGDRAIDIVWFLLELELDLQTGTLAMGAYHVPQSAMSPTSSSSWFSSPTSPTAKSPIRMTNGAELFSHRDSPLSSQSPTKSKPNSQMASQNTATFDWQIVAPRKPPPNDGPHPLSLSIPAYNGHRGTGSAKVRGAGNGFGKGGKGDVGELRATRRDMRKHVEESWKKQGELLREASKAWRNGNSKSRGGEIAQYFAERARETHEVARRKAFNEARRMVEAKRRRSSDPNTLDLHNTCVSEALEIVREVLDNEGCSPSKPLRLITGRGTHSANGVSVLKPAIRNALTRDGWNVSVWDGGLVVRGQNSGC